jgi:hypothetical protein
MIMRVFITPVQPLGGAAGKQTHDHEEQNLDSIEVRLCAILSQYISNGRSSDQLVDSWLCSISAPMWCMHRAEK